MLIKFLILHLCWRRVAPPRTPVPLPLKLIVYIKLNFVSISATQKGVAYFKSAARPFFNNSGTVKAEIWNLGRYSDLYNRSATQKGVAYFKRAATPFFNNSGTVGPRKLKFGI